MSCPFDRKPTVKDPEDDFIDISPPSRYTSTIPLRFLHISPTEYPVYLLNTTNHSDHMRKIRTLSLGCKLSTYDEFKSEGNKFYQLEDYDRALECYEHAYGLFKYLEIKDDNPTDRFDIIFPEGTPEENELRNKAVVQILSNLAYCFIKLRNFDEACEAVKEALEIKPNDPMLISIQIKIKLANVRYDNMKKILKNIKKISKIDKKYEVLVEKFNSVCAIRDEIIDKIYKIVASSYVKHEVDFFSEYGNEKELEHRIVEKMQEKYYQIIEFYIENSKTGNLPRIREELKAVQMILYKMDFAFAIDSKNSRLINEIKSLTGKSDSIIPSLLDAVKRVCISLLFNEGKFNEQLLSFCMEKCTQDERKKQKITIKKSNAWTWYLLYSVIPIIIGGLVYRF